MDYGSISLTDHYPSETLKHHESYLLEFFYKFSSQNLLEFYQIFLFHFSSNAYLQYDNCALIFCILW